MTSEVRLCSLVTNTKDVACVQPARRTRGPSVRWKRCANFFRGWSANEIRDKAPIGVFHSVPVGIQGKYFAFIKLSSVLVMA